MQFITLLLYWIRYSSDVVVCSNLWYEEIEEVEDYETENKRQDYLDENYDNIRYERKEELREAGYTEHVIDNTDDGRDEYVKKEKENFISNLK